MEQLTALLAKAEAALEARDWRAAHELLTQAARREPGSAQAWFLLGVIGAEHGNLVKALELFDRALTLDSSLARAQAQKARVLIGLNRREDALAAAASAEALAPSDALSLDTLGVVLTRAGLHERALGFYERAAALRPDNASMAYNLAAARQFAGDFDGAALAYARVLALDPASYRAASALTGLRRQTPEDNRIPALEAVFVSAGGDADAALHLGHALAKSYEDLGDYGAALDWLGRAKAGKAAASVHDPARDAELFAAAASEPVRSIGASDAAPIFVVGLPRTGTTLVDRILSSHPDVVSAGELTNFALIVKRMAATPSNLVLDAPTLRAAGSVDLAAAGRAYLQSVRAIIGEAERFVDKMPLNVFYAGLIHAALPNARIICLRRGAMDSVLSNYRQLFATGFSYYNYALGLEDTARYYLGFDGLVRHWRLALPADRFTEVSYEGLVADQEGETRRVLDFCGLDWNPACLAFHENAAPVATASSVQVRSPLYASSIGRWKRYGERLDGVRAILEAAGAKL